MLSKRAQKPWWILGQLRRMSSRSPKLLKNFGCCLKRKIKKLQLLKQRCRFDVLRLRVRYASLFCTLQSERQSMEELKLAYEEVESKSKSIEELRLLLETKDQEVAAAQASLQV